MYYWRIARIPDLPTDEKRWRDSSFIHIPDAPQGFNQSHYYQWLYNDFAQLQIDSMTRRWEYPLTTNALFAQNSRAGNDLKVQLGNTVLVEYISSCLKVYVDCTDGIGVVVLKPDGVLQPLYSINQNGAVLCNGVGQYGNIHCSPEDRPSFEFDTSNDAAWEDLLNLVERIAEQLLPTFLQRG